MALLHNTVIQSAMLGRRMTGLEPQIPMTGLVRAERKNWFEGEHNPDTKSGYADGCRHPASWMMARTAGGMSSRYFAGMEFPASGAGAMGLPASGTATMVIDTNSPAGQLIVSGTGSASLTITIGGNVLAALFGDGSASLSITPSATLLAKGWVVADGAFSVTSTLTSYARGFMVGSTAAGGALTESSIIAAMNASPPKVNIAKVNDVDVTGTGAPGNEWGP